MIDTTVQVRPTAMMTWLAPRALAPSSVATRPSPGRGSTSSMHVWITTAPLSETRAYW
jgi:hypothetical protein